MQRLGIYVQLSSPDDLVDFVFPLAEYYASAVFTAVDVYDVSDQGHYLLVLYAH